MGNWGLPGDRISRLVGREFGNNELKEGVTLDHYIILILETIYYIYYRQITCDYYTCAYLLLLNYISDRFDQFGTMVAAELRRMTTPEEIMGKISLLLFCPKPAPAPVTTAAAPSLYTAKAASNTIQTLKNAQDAMWDMDMSLPWQ